MSKKFDFSKKKKCLACNKLFYKNYNVCKKQWDKTKYCSSKCYFTVNPFKRRGKDNQNWKGDNIGYTAIHIWLTTNFKKPTKCEHPNCSGKSKQIEWCLIKGKKYERKRENFICFCHSCHFKYDMNDVWRKRLSIQAKKYWKHQK